MVTLEQVEKLRHYANISYDEARNALEKAGGDILEAIIILEKQNLVKESINGGYHNTRRGKQNTENDFKESEAKNGTRVDKNKGTSFSELMGRVFKWLGAIISKGNMNYLEVVKDGNNVIAIPVTVFAILLLFMFWAIVPLIVIGLFFGYRYTFIGPDLGKEKLNRVMDSAAKAAENFKKEMKSDNSDGENSGN